MVSCFLLGWHQSLSRVWIECTVETRDYETGGEKSSEKLQKLNKPWFFLGERGQEVFENNEAY